MYVCIEFIQDLLEKYFTFRIKMSNFSLDRLKHADYHLL